MLHSLSGARTGLSLLVSISQREELTTLSIKKIEILMGYSQAIIGLSVIAVCVLIPPLAWHTKTRNVPAIILITWLLLMNIKQIVDAAIWGGDDYASKWNGYGWCDVITKIQVGANVGISCAVANIAFNLHRIIKADKEIPDNRSWKKIRIDLAISLICPILIMVLIYLVQVFRYGIFRYNGCQSVLSPTWLTTVLYTIWMLIWSTIGFIYASLLLYVFYRKRKDVKDILHCTNSGLNISRFSRLLIFCMLIILVMFPFSIYSFVTDLKNVSYSYRHYSFAETHRKSLWGLILHFDPGVPLYSVWLYILMSYLVFLIFGLGSDALYMYAGFIRNIGCGVFLDKISEWRSKIYQSKISKIADKILPGTLSSDEKSYQLYGENVSDGSSSANTYSDKTNSPTSTNYFEIDYTLPYDSAKSDKRQHRGFDPKLSVLFKSLSVDSEESSSETNQGSSPGQDSAQFEYHYRLDHH